MNQQPKRARRCQLSVPGSSEKMMTKASSLDLDHVFLDLEDAVAPSAKPGARGKSHSHRAHHRTGDDWCIYPLYDFAHCLEDAFEGVTLIRQVATQGAGDRGERGAEGEEHPEPLQRPSNEEA